MVTVPEMRRGGVALVFGSIFVMSGVLDGTDHNFDPELGKRGKKQLDVYRQLEEDGHVRIIRTKHSLDDHLTKWQDDSVPGLLIAMEGAEPIESPDELDWWFDAGLRMASTAWGPSRYSGGYAGSKGSPEGLTPLGRELVDAMASRSVVLDLCHSSPQLFWDGVECDHPHVVCTHTTSRELLGVERLPNADMFAALAARGGIIGLGLGNIFADKTWFRAGKGEDVRLGAFGALYAEIATHAGWDHLAIGSDLDGGIGVEESPVELDTIADIGRLGDVLPDEARAGVLGENWLSFLRTALPD